MTNTSIVSYQNKGWIYLVRFLDTNNLYKIGRTKDIIRRLPELERQSSKKIKLIDSFFTLNANRDERKIHQDLSDYQVFNECFELNPEILADKLGIYCGDCNSNLFRGDYYSNFWFLSEVLFEEIDLQLNKFCEDDWGKEKNLIREELMTLTSQTICTGDIDTFYHVVDLILPGGLSKSYSHEYKYITGNKMSRYEYILGILVGTNLALKTKNQQSINEKKRETIPTKY